jgi:hypothetical protein
MTQSNTKTDEEMVAECMKGKNYFQGKGMKEDEEKFRRILSQVRKESLEQGRRDERWKMRQFIYELDDKKNCTVGGVLKEMLDFLDTLSPSEEGKGK